MAKTWNPYAVPLVRLVTMHEVAVAVHVVVHEVKGATDRWTV